MQCPKCGAEAPEGARFCELDGTRLVPENGSAADSAAPDAAGVAAPAGCRCGADASAIDAQGYCGECGRFCGLRERDHIEIVLNAAFGGVTDRGKRHAQNEDDLSIALLTDAETASGKTAHILIVCDGVSSSQHAEQASRAACEAARSALIQAVQSGASDPEQAIRQAIRDANEAVCALPHSPDIPKEPPETTLVAALVQEGIAAIGWVGDSRAYWFSDTQATPLTRDHSWINEVVEAGEMSMEEAAVSPGAHAITRCLGVPDADDADGSAVEPSFLSFPLPGAGRLLLCSDGLWNYAPGVEQIAALIQAQPAEAEAVSLARSLVEFANAQGGRDNITVAIAAFA